MNHYDMVTSNSARLTGTLPLVVYMAVTALSNKRLAWETDVQEMIDHAVNPELCRELRAMGACAYGIADVGVHARDWNHLKELCEEWAEECNDIGYITWLEDNIPELFEGDI